MMIILLVLSIRKNINSIAIDKGKKKSRITYEN